MANSLAKSFEKKWASLKENLGQLLSQGFYERHSVEVAKDLLGKIIVVRTNTKWVGGRIVETEAYRQDDPASHSYRGETPRSSVMFGEPGRAYVYFIYGMYEMLNFVTEPKGQGSAVLIRALEPLFGLEGKATQGPGRLCNALGIQMAHNREFLMGPTLFVYDDGYKPTGISQSPRVGIRLATDKQWRFFITGHPSVSRAPQNFQQTPCNDV